MSPILASRLGLSAVRAVPMCGGDLNSRESKGGKETRVKSGYIFEADKRTLCISLLLPSKLGSATAEARKRTVCLKALAKSAPQSLRPDMTAMSDSFTCPPAYTTWHRIVAFRVLDNDASTEGGD